MAGQQQRGRAGLDIVEEGESKPEVRVTMPDGLQAVYANMLQVSHTEDEFLLDFMFISGEMGKACARIVLTPVYFQRVMGALTENWEHYQRTKGAVDKSKDT